MFFSLKKDSRTRGHEIHDVVRPEIIEQILNRVVTKTTSPVSHFIALLSKTVMSAPQVMLDLQPKVREAFDYLPLLPLATAHGLLRAILPLMKISTSLKDSLSLVLKKAMFSRQVESRRIAVSGYLLMLQNFRVLGGPACSQASQSLSLSQVHVDVHLRYNPASNESLCLEILGNLRRCLSQQAPVRLTLYEGLYEVVHRNSQLVNPVLSVLLAQLRLYYETEEDVNPPLKLDPCVTAQGGTDVFPVEPLAHFLSCIVQCVLMTHSLPAAADDDDEDDDNIAQSEIREILRSLTRRMVKSDLEDFELDKEANFTTSTGVGIRNNIFALLLSGLYEVLIEYNLSVADFEVGRYEEAAHLFDGYQKLSDILKSSEKTGAGGGGKKGRPAASSSSGGVTKSNKSLLSIRFISTLLESVLGQNNNFMRYIINVALQKVQQVADRGSCDGPGGTNSEKLFKYVTSIARVLLRHYKEELHNLPEAAEQKKERNNRQVALLCLEGIVAIIGIVCGRYPDKLMSFLLALEGRSDTEEQDEGEAAQLTYIHHHIKQFQRMVLTTISADGEDRRLKESLLLLNMISLLCKQLPPEGAEFAQVLHWTQRLCTEQTPDDSAVTKVLLSLLLQLTRPTKSVLPVIRDLARDIHIHLGDIDQAVQVEGASIYPVVTARTAAPITLLLVLGQIDRELDDTEWAINRLRMDTLTVVDGNDSPGTQQEEKEKSAITRLGHMINCMHELVQSATPAGACAENVVKTLTRLYSSLSLATKYYVSLYQQKVGHLPSRFEKLVRLSGTGLTQLVYAMITYMQAAQSDTIQQAKDDGKKKKTSASAVVGKARVLKEMRTIPNLIFAIEQYEKFLIQLSKKSKINLMEHIKLSTSRDFRINTTVLQELTEQAGDTSSGDSDDIVENQTADNIGEESQENASSKQSKKRKSSASTSGQTSRKKGKFGLSFKKK
ncbi:Fanconi anemia group I protein [Lamellibrachia satsuma]|nr:Fanconi anemia group I protein [Lamellibrachia satsuma]